MTFSGDDGVQKDVVTGACGGDSGDTKTDPLAHCEASPRLANVRTSSGVVVVPKLDSSEYSNDSSVAGVRGVLRRGGVVVVVRVLFRDLLLLLLP